MVFVLWFFPSIPLSCKACLRAYENSMLEGDNGPQRDRDDKCTQYLDIYKQWRKLSSAFRSNISVIDTFLLVTYSMWDELKHTLVQNHRTINWPAPWMLGDMTSSPPWSSSWSFYMGLGEDRAWHRVMALDQHWLARGCVRGVPLSAVGHAGTGYWLSPDLELLQLRYFPISLQLLSCEDLKHASKTWSTVQ